MNHTSPSSKRAGKKSTSESSERKKGIKVLKKSVDTKKKRASSSAKRSDKSPVKKKKTGSNSRPRKLKSSGLKR